MVYSTDPSIIRLAGCIPDSSVDGPGIRYVLFFQGCPHKCAGCHNPATHLWDSDDCEDVPVEVILDHFKDNAASKRVTISGGEPFGQPNALLNLLQKLREKGVKDIWIYTGYTYEELCSDELRKEILANCSTVVTGRFIMSKREGAPLFVGSTNQEIIKINEVI